MLITRSVKCLSIPHKIRIRIEYTRQRHAKCQNMFECAINRHKIRIVDSIWILIPVQRQRWSFTRVWSAEARASLLLPPGMCWAVSTINLLATLMDQDPGHGGVMVKYDTLPGHFIHCAHHISVFGSNNDSILSLYTFRNSHSTIYLIVHRLHATDGVRENIWRNLIKIVHVHLMIYYQMFYSHNLQLKYALHPNFPPLSSPRITFWTST